MAGENLFWKDDIDDLRSRAESVVRASSSEAPISARTAARCLSGICGLISRRWTVDEMQRTCAQLARYEHAWTTALGRLPHTNGFISEPTQLVACVARGLIPLAGAEGVRAALSFWASETDPAVWQAVAIG